MTIAKKAAECIEYKGHLVFIQGKRRVRAYTESDGKARDGVQVGAKGILKQIADELGVSYDEKTTTDQLGERVFGAVREPGWDAKAISEIVQQYFSGKYLSLFKVHGWPERGNKMMPAAGKRIAEQYGSVAAFVESWEGEEP